MTRMRIPPKPYVPKYANYDYLPVWQGNVIVGWIKVYYTVKAR